MRKIAALVVGISVLLSTLLPCFAYAEVDPELGFEVSSEAVYLVNNETGLVIYEKNANEKMYPASLTKIMTAIVAIENCDDLEGSVATAPTYVFDQLWGLNASNADIRHGEEVRMIDLLYALMLRSACEAAGIIADYISGGQPDQFIAMMNDKAKEIGANDTYFVNPHGLHDDNQYTTAEDMYKITAYAMENPIFAQIACSNSYEMPATNKHSEPRTIYHTNTMMDPNRGGSWYYPYIRGIKTGTTDESGRNLVSMAVKDAYSYTLVTLGAPIYYDNGDEISDNMSYVDAKKLYDWAFDNWSVRSVVKTSSVEGQVKVNLVKDKDVVSVFPAEDVDYLLRKDIDIESSIQKVLVLQESVDAPVNEGDVLGTMEIRLADKLIATVDLVAGETLERDGWLYFLSKLKGFFGSLWVKLAVVLLLLIVALYVAYMVMYNKKRRRRRRRRF